MYVSLEGFRFPIPFKSISSGEFELIERLDKRRRKGEHMMGEGKISDRQATIILSYIITSLLHYNPSSQSGDTRRGEDSIKSVIYLCKSEERKKKLITIAQKVQTFVQQQVLKNQHSQLWTLQGGYQSKIMLRLFDGSYEDQAQHQHYLETCKDKGMIFKRLYILKSSKFIQSRLRKKEQIIWKKIYQFGCEHDFTTDPLSFLIKKADYLLVQTNDMESHLGQLFTTNLYQVHLHRAFNEFKALNRYYNYRLDEKKNKNHLNKHGSKKEIQNKEADSKIKQEQQRKKLQEKTKNEERRQIRIDEKEPVQIDAIGVNEAGQDKGEKNEKEKPKIVTMNWKVSQYDRKLNDLYKQKKEQLMAPKVGYISSSSTEYQECYYLMNLQIVGYILSFLQVEWRQKQFQENSESLANFLDYCYSNTLIPTTYMRKLRRIFLAFLHKHPPKLCGQQLSYLYIDQVLIFFEKAVIWHELFCKTNNASQTTDQNRFIVFRQKYNRDSNLRLTTFDQSLILDIFLESSKSFSIIQNMAPSFDYYSKCIHRPDKITDLKSHSSNYCYCCPKLISAFSKYNIYGFIVTSTPNEEPLTLAPQRQETSGSDRLEDNKKEDKQLYHQIIRAYGVLVHDLCEISPDGIIVYFPTKTLLRDCRAEWQNKENIYERINNLKKIYEEDDWETTNNQRMRNFKKNCIIGRGAVFFVSAESQFGKFATFYGPFSRCIIFLGVPYHPFAHQTEQKLKYLRLKEHYRFEQALKNVSRCLSNCVNSYNQQKSVVFADINYNHVNLQKDWFPFIKDGNLNTLQVLDQVANVNKNAYSNNLKKQQEEKTYRLQSLKRVSSIVY